MRFQINLFSVCASESTTTQNAGDDLVKLKTIWLLKIIFF